MIRLTTHRNSPREVEYDDSSICACICRLAEARESKVLQDEFSGAEQKRSSVLMTTLFRWRIC